jgi:hypothetical protein
MAITPNSIRNQLIAAVLFLAACMAFHIAYPDHFLSLSQLFNFNHERNFPTFFQTILWLLSAGLCLRISKSQKKLSLQWHGAGLIAFFLAVDEYVTVHDQLTVPLRNAFDLKGIFFFSWVIVYGVLLLLLLPFAIKFVRKLPRVLCFQFVISGIIFVTGAFGVELIGSYWASQRWSERHFLYISAFEESLEILGQSMFLYFLYAYVYKTHPAKAFQTSSYRFFYGLCLACGVLIALNRFGYY